MSDFVKEMDSKEYWRVARFFKKAHEERTSLCLQEIGRDKHPMATMNGKAYGKDGEENEEQVDVVKC